jgi:Uncharacterized protein conserved in bacteria (DUF2336).
MSLPAHELSEVEQPVVHKARAALLKRLADVVSLPASRVNAFERSVTGDLLVEMLRLASRDERLRVARRLAPLSELPSSLTRMLLRDEPSVARVLIEEGSALSDVDLVNCVHDTHAEHRIMIAGRRNLSEVVSEALVGCEEPDVIAILLKNRTSHISQTGLEIAVALSRTYPKLCAPLLRRPELRPSGAYVMFWWCGPDERRTILQRFAVSREVMQEVATDVFAMAAAENWQDPVARKALQFIERRQRNRTAIERSPFASLEQAVEVASREGLSPDLATEIAYLAGIKPLTGAKLLGDPGGEPVAILCKATGLDRTWLVGLWRSMRRPEVTPSGAVDPVWDNVLATYDMLAVDRAQTVLRYWNWSLSSAMSPQLLQAIREGELSSIDEFSVAERTAMLALSDEFRN